MRFWRCEPELGTLCGSNSSLKQMPSGICFKLLPFRSRSSAHFCGRLPLSLSGTYSVKPSSCFVIRIKRRTDFSARFYHNTFRWKKPYFSISLTKLLPKTTTAARDTRFPNFNKHTLSLCRRSSNHRRPLPQVADGATALPPTAYRAVPLYTCIAPIRFIASTEFSYVPNAVRRKKCSPFGPKPEPGVPTTFACSSR